MPKRKEDILTNQVKHLFNTIGEDDILKEINGQLTVGGKPISEGEKRLLVSEAAVFSQTKLWKYLQNDIKYRANKKMFEESKTELDLVAGKLWLYTLDCIRTWLEKLSKTK